MIKGTDIVTLDVEDIWFREGLDYALISWTSTFNRMGKPNPYHRLQKIILGLIAEKALEDYLTKKKIEYETHGKTKWYEEDRYDIGLNGYAIDVKSNFLDLKTNYIQNKLNNLFEDKLTWFTKCHALVPLDQFNPGENERRAHKRDKVYIFPFIEGFFAENENKHPYIHALWDYKWLKRAEHKDLPNLGKLKIKYNGTLKNAVLVIHGTTSKNKVCVEKLKINENEMLTKNNFFQVFSLEWQGNMPDAVLQIEATAYKLREIINPKLNFMLQKSDVGYWPFENAWQSLAIYDCKVHLLGWIYEEDFRIEGKEFKRFTKTIEQYSEIKVDNWGCLVKYLQPMSTIKKI